MSDWQVTLESGGPTEAGFGETPSSPAGRKWIALVVGFAIFVAVAAIFALRERRTVNQASLREDLTAVIYQEETLRTLGQGHEALINPKSPSSWQLAYRQSFETEANEGDLPTVQLETIDFFDGRCAIVTVTSSNEGLNQDPMRGYCLANQGWQRTPLPMIGRRVEQLVINLANGAQLRFFAADQAFAEVLARDLNRFFTRVDQLPVWSTVSPQVASYQDLKIIIEPFDFVNEPLYAVQGQEIFLNSPRLVFTQEDHWPHPLTGEAAVRLTLAEQLLLEAAPLQVQPSRTLPGAGRMVTAAQTVAAIQMILPPEAQKTLLDHWRAQLGGQWVSPFFGDLQGSSAMLPSPQADTTALLMADFIHSINGLDALPLMLQLLPEAISWDRVFRTLLGRSTLAVEVATAHHAHVNATIVSNLSQERRAPPPDLPLMATLLRIDDQPHGRRLYVQVPDHIAPVLVDLAPGVDLDLPGGLPVSPNCRPTDAPLEITGQWLEVKRRLQATQVTMHNRCFNQEP